MRVAVVGHVEWVQFVRVSHVPRPGEIVHALDAWEEPAGGGAVAAVQLGKLAGGVTFFTALGDDELGRRSLERLVSMGVRVEAAFRSEPQRRAFTYLDADAERTITVIGDRMVPALADPLPWEELRDYDAVYFTGGDVGSVRAARRARVLVATPRTLAPLVAAGVELDVLVGSGHDGGEAYRLGDLRSPPRVVVGTEAAAGGRYELADGTRGRFAASPVLGSIVDAYGCGDSFAAGLTFALAGGNTLAESLELAAGCGAACLCGSGPYQGQIRLLP